jgi:hypothetical protein
MPFASAEVSAALAEADRFIQWAMSFLHLDLGGFGFSGFGTGLPLFTGGGHGGFHHGGSYIYTGERGDVDNSGGGPGPSSPTHLLMSGRMAFQASGADGIHEVTDPTGHGSKTFKVDFNHGTYTTHSTSPRAEVKLGSNLREGGTHSFQFGFMREHHTNTTFFQILDHNGSKPSPRMWLSVKNDRYVLHLREGSGAGSRVESHDLGPASTGRRDDIRIDYHRALGDGSVAISINGQRVFERSGISTMYDTHADAYAKFGQYRNQGDTSPGSVYFFDFSESGD